MLIMLREKWWLAGRAQDCCLAVPGSNPAFPQPFADCQFLGGLPPGTILRRRLSSMRGDIGRKSRKDFRFTIEEPSTKKNKENSQNYLSICPIVNEQLGIG
jgi:hypothetical protein